MLNVVRRAAQPRDDSLDPQDRSKETPCVCARQLTALAMATAQGFATFSLDDLGGATEKRLWHREA